MRVLLDSGAQENFISQRVAVEEGLQMSSSPNKAFAVDGHEVRVYGEYHLETYATDASGTRGLSRQRYLATDLTGYDAILGYPWLSDTDPNIRWKKGVWFYRKPKVEGVEEVSVEELLSDPNAAQVGIIFVHLSPASSTRCVIGALSTSGEGEPTIPKEYSNYSDVFSEGGNQALPEDSKVRHSIEIEEDKEVPYGPIYPLNSQELKALREYITAALAKGWIRPSESSAGAPILFVPKKDGSLRLCVDYRALNKITKKNRYPLPLISEILDRLVGAKIFTKLDLRDAYHRIPIAEKDRWKTAFRTRYGHFEYKVMPFGLTNAPATFQAYINEALRGLLDDICIAFMDDILIYSRDVEEHATHVRAVLERLRKYGLYVKLSKCEFSVEEVSFLGYRVGADGVTMDPSRVAAIKDWPTPTTYREIQVFLGFANFYRGFIHRYSAVVASITDLLVGMQMGKKKGPFLWTTAADHAFQTLKDCFTQAPMLVHFDPERQSLVETDASGGAIGGILSQAYETPGGRTRWHPVAFYSKKMTKAERRYTTGDAEMLAIIQAFKVWRHYLEAPAIRTLVLTDHEALQCFMTTKALNRRQLRWAETLACFDFKIKYRKGKDNPADALSRRPDHMVVEDSEEENPLRELLRARMSDAPDPRADHTQEAERVTIAVMTGATTEGSRDPSESQYNAIRLPTEQEKPQMAKDVAPEQLDSVRKACDALEQRLRDLQTSDAWCREKEWEALPEGKVKSGLFRGSWSVDHAGIVRRNGAAYIPRDSAVRNEILRVNHDDPWQGGHFGQRRTHATILRHYWWPHIGQDILRYVKTCDICQRMKVPRHKPYGLLSPLSVPKEPWQDISLDYIVGLPPSARDGRAYDAILVVVDRYSKMVRFLPCRSTTDAPDLARMIIEDIVSKYGAPRSIVSDRGSTFTSTYWGTLCYYLATRRCFSTAFHPQTDGQTERMNQTLECYLRCYINFQQNDWAELLPGAEYAMNNAVSASTGKTPFEICYRWSPQMRMNIARDPQQDNLSARAQAESLQSSLLAGDEARRTAEREMAKHYDKKRKDMSYKPGDQVLLATRHIRTIRVSKKLADKFIGPFQVLERIGNNAYRLELPKKYGKIHHTFHVSLLEPYRTRDGFEPPEPIDIDGDEEWEVDEILAERTRYRKKQYYVRWAGFSEAHDSWEPEQNLINAQDAIRRFKERNRKTQTSET